MKKHVLILITALTIASQAHAVTNTAGMTGLTALIGHNDKDVAHTFLTQMGLADYQREGEQIPTEQTQKAHAQLFKESIVDTLGKRQTELSTNDRINILNFFAFLENNNIRGTNQANFDTLWLNDQNSNNARVEQNQRNINYFLRQIANDANVQHQEIKDIILAQPEPANPLALAVIPNQDNELLIQETEEDVEQANATSSNPERAIIAYEAHKPSFVKKHWGKISILGLAAATAVYMYAQQNPEMAQAVMNQIQSLGQSASQTAQYFYNQAMEYYNQYAATKVQQPRECDDTMYVCEGSNAPSSMVQNTLFDNIVQPFADCLSHTSLTGSCPNPNFVAQPDITTTQVIVDQPERSWYGKFLFGTLNLVGLGK